LVVVAALAGVAVRAWPPAFDIQILQTIADQRAASLTRVAEVVTGAGSFALLAPLAIAFLLLLRWKQPADGLVLLVVAAGSAALPAVVKLIVGRPRPTIEHMTHLVSLSFPSEHTTQAAAAYLAIAILLSKDLNRRWRGLMVVIALLIALAVAWSRVYLSLHYPTDVVAGLLLGWSWALLLIYWARPRLLQQSPAEPVTAANGTATS
jgi:undecaprenyl-diphosphatase